MKTFFTAILLMAAMNIAAPVLASDNDLSPIHFSLENLTGWNTEATGHMALSFQCPVHHEKYLSLHDVLYHGFGVTKRHADGYPFPVLYFGEETPAGLYGYIIHANASVYIHLVADEHGDMRWIILAIDPAEDGLNGNELPR